MMQRRMDLGVLGKDSRLRWGLKPEHIAQAPHAAVRLHALGRGLESSARSVGRLTCAHLPMHGLMDLLAAPFASSIYIARRLPPHSYPSGCCFVVSCFARLAIRHGANCRRRSGDSGNAGFGTSHTNPRGCG